MNLLFGYVFFVVVTSFSSPAKSSEVVECYNCDHHKTISAWGLGHLQVGEQETITLVDIYNKNACSYGVSISSTPTLPGEPDSPIVTYRTEQVPPEISTMMSELQRASSALVSEAKSKAIPKNIIASPWEFVNCSYCRADINDYLNSSLSGKIRTVEATAITIAQALNLLNTSVANQFQIPLEAEGSILVELTVINSPIKLEVEINRILDADNNEVKQDVDNLNNMNIKAALKAHIEDMNNYLNPLGYGVNLKPLRFTDGFYRGRVTILGSDYK